MKDFGLLLMFSSIFRALSLKWQLFPFIMKHFGARASDARCSLRDYALQRAFLGLGALQPAPKRAAACVFWQRSGLGRAAAPIGALQRVASSGRAAAPIWCAAARVAAATHAGRAAAPIWCAAARVAGARGCSALQRMLCAAACASPTLWSSLRAVAHEGALQRASLGIQSLLFCATKSSFTSSFH